MGMVAQHIKRNHRLSLFCILSGLIFMNLKDTTEMLCKYLKKILSLDGDNLSTAATTAAAAAAVTAAVAAGVVGGGFLGGRAEAEADPGVADLHRGGGQNLSDLVLLLSRFTVVTLANLDRVVCILSCEKTT
jgi:hypothetical protein